MQDHRRVHFYHWLKILLNYYYVVYHFIYTSHGAFESVNKDISQ